MVGEGRQGRSEERIGGKGEVAFQIIPHLIPTNGVK